VRYNLHPDTGVSIPHRYDKNFESPQNQTSWGAVSIPHRYDKNTGLEMLSILSERVSIPHRYDKNPVRISILTATSTSFNSS